MSIDQSEYYMTPEEERRMEEKNSAATDTKKAMFMSYKEAGYKWCPVKDAFIHMSGHWILGYGTATYSTTPVEVSDITNAESIALGFFHSCALLSPPPSPLPQSESSTSTDNESSATRYSVVTALMVSIINLYITTKSV